jgi:tetratricopeptide (TPR) repeat protein
VHYAEVLTRANRLDAAAAALATATARLRALPGDTGVARRVDEADLSMKLARVLRRLDRNGEARKAQERAITIYAQLATEHPDLPRYADQEAAGWYFLAHLGESESKPEEAADAIAKAVAIREKLAARNPQNHHLGMLYVRSLLTSADLAMQAAQRHDGDFGAAEQTLARAIAVIDPMALAHPNDSEVLKTHAAIHGANAALATVQQRFRDARREHGIVRDAARARLAVDGKDADVHYQLAMACNNLMQVHLLENDADAAVLAGEEGKRHLELGLELDARNEPLLALVPWLFARLSHSYADLGEIDDAMATLQRMIAKPEWGADAREQGCLHLTEMLGEQPGHPGHRQWCERLLADLRQCLAARGSLADALARRPQAKGLSRQHTALRDFDLRLCAVRMLQHLGRVDEQRPLLDELARLVAVLPGLEAQRQRAFTERRASAALASDDLAGAAASAADLVGSLGHEGAACALAATIYVRASDASKVDADREQWAKAAVDCLASAIKTGEITAASLRGGMFSPLHGRPDYEALFPK